MENQNTPETTANNAKKMLQTVIPVVIAAILGYFLISNVFLSGGTKKEAIEAAESYAISQLYKDAGLTAKNLKSEIIYEGKNGARLISVLCSLDNNSDWVAAYCVYTENEYLINATNMLPTGYDFRKNIDELKALFGIVS